MTHATDGDRSPPHAAPAGWIDLCVLDVRGEPIGVVVGVHPPALPEWLVISTGLLSTPVAVPVDGSVRIGHDIVLAHHRQVVFTAPGNAELMTIDPVAARAIAAHFGLAAGASLA